MAKFKLSGIELDDENITKEDIEKIKNSFENLKQLNNKKDDEIFKLKNSKEEASGAKTTVQTQENQFSDYSKYSFIKDTIRTFENGIEKEVANWLEQQKRLFNKEGVDIAFKMLTTSLNQEKNKVLGLINANVIDVVETYGFTLEKFNFREFVLESFAIAITKEQGNYLDLVKKHSLAKEEETKSDEKEVASDKVEKIVEELKAENNNKTAIPKLNTNDPINSDKHAVETQNMSTTEKIKKTLNEIKQKRGMFNPGDLNKIINDAKKQK